MARSALPLLALLLLPACVPSAPAENGAGAPAPAPVEAPAKVDVRGRITKIQAGEGEGVVGVIRVEGGPGPGAPYDKASVRISRDTRILQGRSGAEASFEALTVGDLVEATFEGPVMESYPVQARASRVVILESAGPAEPAGSSEPPGEWTAGIVEVSRPDVAPALLRGVRTARQEGFDRVVFEFEGAVPGYHLEYVDRPVRQCGSGEPVELAGDGWLEVRLAPARAHTEEGRATVEERERHLDLPVVRELESTCDFEAHVTWVLGVASPNRYRVQELADPPRLVVDVRH